MKNNLSLPFAPLICWLKSKVYGTKGELPWQEFAFISITVGTSEAKYWTLGIGCYSKYLK